MMMNEQLDRIEKDIKIIFEMLKMLGVRQLTQKEIEREKKRKEEQKHYTIQWKYGNDDNPPATTRTEHVFIASGDNNNPYKHMVTNGGNAPWNRRLTQHLACPKCGARDISSDTGNTYICYKCQHSW